VFQEKKTERKGHQKNREIKAWEQKQQKGIRKCKARRGEKMKVNRASSEAERGSSKEDMGVTGSLSVGSSHE